MKNIIYLFALVLSLTTTADVSAQKGGERDQYKVQVDGLGCPFCAFGLEKKFKEFKGIKDVQIDMESGLFEFSYPADNPLSLDQVETQVTLAGYTPIWLEIYRVDGAIEKSKKELPQFEVDESQVVTNTLKVNGKCSMCESRIERACNYTAGVIEAQWDKKSKVLSLKYDSSLVSLEEIENAVVGAGYDTVNKSADDEVYANLPACCQYKRRFK